MNAIFKEYRDFILFVWGLSLLTVIIVFHIITDYAAYLILGAAIGLPLFIKGTNGKKENSD
jgi:uncharacterized membrane protein